MYLKSIEVHGFKSFANKIIFNFHNGITGIVGPNGSGKSNVGDAVRWVLGEQSAKQLRGASMQDVIFSGTENRKPLGYAYVAITLDNTDHKLPVEYEEVTVARRVYRSGESEYLMNGTSCRLKDVQELFYDTGIGKEGYSIIGQGQIDKILSGKPEERRELFDEAAGIVKFKRRKAVAQKKLEDEKQNLVRVSDILTELEKQLQPLEAQAEVAKQYLKKKEELKELDVNLFLNEAEQMKVQLAELEEKVRIANEDFESTKLQYENTKSDYEKIESEIEQMQSEIEQKRDAYNQANLSQNDMEGRLNVCKEQIRSVKVREEHLASRLEIIQNEVVDKNRENEDFLSQKQLIDKQIEEMEQIQLNCKDDLQSIQTSIASLNTSIEDGKNNIFSILNERASTKGKLQRYDTMLEQLAIQKAELSQRLLKIKSDEAVQEELLSKYQAEFDAITKVRDSLLEKSKKTENDIALLQQSLTDLSKGYSDKQMRFHQEKSRLESLQNLTERYEGYGNSIKKVMEQKEKGIIGVVADIIKVEKAYETAIETALGGSIQNIVSEDEDTAKRMIQFLKTNKLGRATFLPLTSIGNKSTFTQEKALQETGVIGLASNLIKTEERFLGLSTYLLGRTVVVDDMNHAISLARKFGYTLRIVTLEGESLSPGGSITGGTFRNSSNLLGRRREMEELEKEVQSIKDEAISLKEDIEAKKTERSECYKTLEELKQQIQEQSLLHHTAKMNSEQAESRKRESIELLLGLKNETTDLDSQMREIAATKESIQAELLESQQQEKELEDKINQLQQSLEEERKKEASLTGETAEITVKYANLNQQNEFLLQNIQRINQEIKRLQTEQSELETDFDLNKENARLKEAKISDILTTKQNTEQFLITMQKQIEELMVAKESLTVEHKGFFQKREELSSRMTNLDKEIFRLNSQREKLEESNENSLNYMWEEYELTYSSALDFKKPLSISVAEMKAKILNLKEEIRKLGDVNVNAIEDYKSIFERHHFLKEQHDDLIRSEDTLLKIIEELDCGMRKQFAERFAFIQQEYDKAFRDLFGGGKGTLELMEEEDILEAGIRIIAQPPGKKLQNMMQLSGGEKALSAIALLFAIQNLKPSPFCLLDEIEAALDDSNVGRFAQYLHKLTKNTQFIIITHRRGTMAAADRLYGITMQEKGVSTLVSVNLIEDDLEK